CIFCNQRKITNYEKSIDMDSVRNYIDNYISYFNNNDVKREIAFYGGSFTGIKREDMISYLKIANEYIDKGMIDSIRLSTRPDYIDDEILTILKKYKVETIELGVQSMNDEVLIANNRGHNSQAVICASNLIHEYDFKLGLQMMIGLYKDDEKTAFKTAKKFIEMKPDIVRIYPTLVIEDTYLETLYKLNKYTPLDINKAVKIIKPIYALFKVNDIDVSRIGLQPTENINEEGSVVAGPFHAAFRQLVEQELYREALEKYLSIYKNIDEIFIEVPNSQMSYIVGNKAENKKYLKNRFNISKISFKAINGDKIYITINNDKKIELDIKEFYREYLLEKEV